MRRVAALYDVHGNLPALDAVLAEIEREELDAVVLGGDLAGGPMPAETLDRLLALGERARFVRGNGERELVAAFDAPPAEAPDRIEDPALRTAAWCAPRLERRHRDAMAAFPERVTIEVDGLGEVLFCHGSPRSDEEILTTLTPEAPLAEALAGVEAAIVVCGHTHAQFDRRYGALRIVNAGSVGMPYEGRPGAFWLALGPEVRLRRTPVDLDAMAAAVRATGYPDAEDLLKESFLEPLEKASVAEYFERAAGR
jgi:predicted phosphodiesterase